MPSMWRVEYNCLTACQGMTALHWLTSRQATHPAVLRAVEEFLAGAKELFDVDFFMTDVLVCLPCQHEENQAKCLTSRRAGLRATAR